MQGRVSEAIAMYNKAIEGERPYNTYDRARKDAYRHLIDIYALGNSIASADELHLKRTTEYRNEACFPYYYAKFRQRHFDDDDIVLEYARKALDAGCQYKASVRKVIGTAYYSKWNEASTPEDMQSYLAQAQSFFAEGPELIHWLSQSEKTVGLIKKLAKDGVSIDVTDNDGFTALAYAVRGKDPEAVKRLIAMGANPNATIKKKKIPLLAVAVIIESKELVGYLIASGADVNAQVSEGVSLLDFANGMGYTDVAEVLRTAGGQRI
jgi:Fe2+ transport system protein FeoA